MKKKLVSVLLAGVMALALAACGGSSNAASSSEAEAPADTTAAEAAPAEGGDGSYAIDVIVKTTASEYWGYVVAGANAYSKDHPEVTVSVKGATSETSYDEQQNMIETDLNSGAYDGFVIAPLQADLVATLIKGQTAPIVAVDTNIEAPEVLSFVGTSNEDAAKMGGEEAVKAAKEAGWDEIKAICISGVMGDSTATARLTGYEAGINGAGGEFLKDEIQYADAVADKAVNCMEAIMQNHPEGIAIICANNDDMALAAANAAAKGGLDTYKNTIFLGFDGQIPAAQAILEGKMTMSTAQNPYDMAYLAVETMVKHLNGETVEPVVDSGYTIITKDNAQEHIDKLSSYGK